MGQLQNAGSNDNTSLREAKSCFETVITLFGNDNKANFLTKSRQKMEEIDKLLAEKSTSIEAQVMRVVIDNQYRTLAF